MIPAVHHEPIYNYMFKHMIVGYDTYLSCTNCNELLPDRVIRNRQKTCPNCHVKIRWDKVNQTDLSHCA